MTRIDRDVLGHDGKVAIAESLAIVGGIALASLFPYARARLVSWRNVVCFGVPGMGSFCHSRAFNRSVAPDHGQNYGSSVLFRPFCCG